MESSMPPHDSSNFHQVEGSSFNHWGHTYPRKNNRLNQSAAMQQQGDDPLRPWNHMKFSVPKRSGLAIPMKLVDGNSTRGSLTVDLNSLWEDSRYVTATTSWMENQGSLDAPTQLFSSRHTLERQHCDLPSHHYGNPCDPNLHQSTVNEHRSTFAPASDDQNKFLIKCTTDSLCEK